MKYDLGLLLTRIAYGGMLFGFHGLGKLMKYDYLAHHFPNPLGLGSTISLILTLFAEVVCALFVVLGAATRVAVVPIIIVMLVAILRVHAGEGMAAREMAFVYLVPFIGLLLTGPGKFSLDSLFGWAKR